MNFREKIMSDILKFLAGIYTGGLLMGYGAFTLHMVVWIGICYAFGGIILGITHIIGMGKNSGGTPTTASELNFYHKPFDRNYGIGYDQRQGWDCGLSDYHMGT